MKTLEGIKEFTENKKQENNKLIEFIDSGDELSAWQTVLGNIKWLKEEDVYIKIVN